MYVYVMLARGTYSATKASYGPAAQLIVTSCVRGERKKGSFTISSLSHPPPARSSSALNKKVNGFSLSFFFVFIFLLGEKKKNKNTSPRQVCMLVVPRSWSSKAESCLRKPTLGLLTGRLARTKS